MGGQCAARTRHAGPFLVAALSLILCTASTHLEVQGKSEEYTGIEGTEAHEPKSGWEGESFDCQAGLNKCIRGWSREKKAWCLEEEDIQCDELDDGTEEEPFVGHRKSSLIDVGISWMLLGSVAFTMALFYLVNYRDDDIRRYVWAILSTTISIFTAVFMFQGINEFVMSFIPEESPSLGLLVNFVTFLTLFITLQVSIAYISGANCEGACVKLNREAWVVADVLRSDCGKVVSEETVQNPVGTKSVAMVDGLEVFVQKSKIEREKRELQMRCWATLFAHMTGFAAINLGGTLQHLPVFKTSPGMTVVAMFINAFSLTALFRATDEIRNRTTAMDGEVDERDELYDEYVEEAENDVAGLSVSFLTVQAMRYWLTGVLPDNDGHESPEYEHSLSCVCGLYLAGLVIGILSIMLVFLFHEAVAKYPKTRRFMEMTQNQGTMIFAWCMIWATRWQVYRSHVMDPIGGPNSMGGRIILALALSMTGFAVVFGLDQVEDMAKSKGESSDVKTVVRVIQSIVNALSILVGFSWENSFHGGVCAVASLTSRPMLIELVLAFLVALFIIPAWLKFILTKVMIHQRRFQDELDARSLMGSWRSAYAQLEYEDLT